MKRKLPALAIASAAVIGCTAPTYQPRPTYQAYQAPTSPSPPPGRPMSFGAWMDHYHPDLAGRHVSQSLYDSMEREYQSYQQSAMFNQQSELERERLQLERERLEIMRAQQEAAERPQD